MFARPANMIGVGTTYYISSIGSFGVTTTLTTASAVFPSANRILYIPVRVPTAMVVSRFFVGNGATASGNLDYLDAAITTRLAGASYTAPDNAGIAAIQNQTDQLVFTTPGRVDASATVSGTPNVNVASIASNAVTAAALAADAVTEIQSGLATGSALVTAQTSLTDIQGRLPAALTGAGNIKADALALDGSTSAAGRLRRSAEQIVYGAAVSGTLSTTQMSTNLTETVNNHHNGKVIYWTSGVLANQATDVTGYNGSTKVLTFTAVTSAPQAGDTFVVI